MRIIERFRMDQGGATAMLFGLSLFPLLGVMGAAVDYSRAANEHTKLQRATDAAVLALVKEPRTATAADLNVKAKAVFGALYQPTPGTVVSDPAVDRQGNTIKLSASGVMPNAFMQVLGMRDVALATEARAAWGTERIELALVLDNTGSMDDDIKGQKKIDVLIASTKKLLEDARAIASSPDDIKISIVPFDTEVRLHADETRYKDWFRDMNPGLRRHWTGYVIDRHGRYATTDDDIGSDEASKYPVLRRSANRSDLPVIQPLRPVSEKRHYDDMVDLVKAMKPRGYTNLTLGVTWGMATLSRSEPFTPAPPPGDVGVKRYMIVLTDGKNTAYYQNGTYKDAVEEKRLRNWAAAERIEREMNDNTRAACTNAKKSIEVFTIKLLDGDDALLGACASPDTREIPQHYFPVGTPAGLSAAFGQILKGISRTHLTH